MSLYIAIAAGYLFHLLFPFLDIRHFAGYEFILYTLLAIGLYGSVYGIELAEFHNHRSLIFRAVTFGVVLKSMLTGSIFWLVFHTPYAFLFGIIVAQIDPLSVAHLVDAKSQLFSKAGRTILRAWSSFDDPMTVLLALYLFLPFVAQVVGQLSAGSYLMQLGTNMLFAVFLYVLSGMVKTYDVGKLGLLLLAFILAIPLKLMLGIALVGLFLRPGLKYLSSWVHAAFIVSAVILGSLLTSTQTYLLYGFTLGVLAFMAQILATFLVAPKLKKTDKLFLAFAQYNGITAIILALIIAEWIPETISIIAMAVICINVLYYVSNHFLKKRLLQ